MVLDIFSFEQILRNERFYAKHPLLAFFLHCPQKNHVVVNRTTLTPDTLPIDHINMSNVAILFQI